MQLPPPLDILRAICAHRGLSFEILDPFSGYLARVSCARTGRFFLAGAGSVPAYPGNDAVLTGIANDKAFTAALLGGAGFGVPQGEYFFVRSDFADQRPPGRELDAAEHFVARHFAKSREPLVVKPNHLSRARFVTLARDTQEALNDLHEIATVDLIGHLQMLIDDPEFRLFIVKGEIIFAYRKGRPQVTGDGKSTIKSLVAPRPELCDARYAALMLSSRSLSWESVLAVGETLPIGFIANLGASGDFLGFVEIHEVLRDWTKRLYAAMPLAVMGIDVFSRSALADPSDFIVSDVNASPSLTTLHGIGQEDVVEAAWSRILALIFESG